MASNFVVKSNENPSNDVPLDMGNVGHTMSDDSSKSDEAADGNSTPPKEEKN